VFAVEISKLAVETTGEAPNAISPSEAAPLIPDAVRDGNGAAPAPPVRSDADAAPAPASEPLAAPVAQAVEVTSRLPEEPASVTAAPNADLLPGISAITERLHDRATLAFTQFATEWLGDRAAAFFRDVDAVADRITEASREGVEIERKYLLRFLPEEARDGRWVDIAQGYLPGTRLHERVRRVSVHHGSGRKDVHFYRTVKLGEGVARTEIEEETTEAIFLALWPLTKRRRLRKRRFEIDVEGRTWEIDEFRNRDLVLAEIELDSEDEEVTFPDWLAPAVQREVTGEPEFQNINLAR
jgi:adenylate cyclase